MIPTPWRSTHLGRRPATVLEVATAGLGLYVMPPVSHLELAARIPDYRPGDLESVLAERRAIGLRTLRGSAFLMPVDLLPVVVPATRERNVRAFAGYLARRLQTATYETWAERVEAVLGTGEMLTKGDLVARLDPPEPDRGLMGHVIGQKATESRLAGVRVAASWRSAQVTYIRWDDWLPGVDVTTPDPDAARVVLARRYLAAWGPASVADLAWWSGLTRTQARAAIAAADAVPVGDDRWDLPGMDRTDTPPAGVRLLPWWDTLFVTWKDRTRFLPADRYPFVYDRDGNATSVVLVDGEVAGVWSLGADDTDLEIRVAGFGSLPWDAVEAEAAVIVALAGSNRVRVVDAGDPVDLTTAPRNRFLRPC